MTQTGTQTYELVVVESDGVELLATGTIADMYLSQLSTWDDEDAQIEDGEIDNRSDLRIVASDIRNCEAGQAGRVCDAVTHPTVCLAGEWLWENLRP